MMIKYFPFILINLLPITLMAQFGPVIQYEEPRVGMFTYAEGITLPAENAGYTLYLPKGNAKGTLLFFNSDRDTTAEIIPKALKKDLALLFVTTGNQLEFLFADSSLAQLDRYIGDALKQHELSKEKILLAGMSLAGTRALKYAQYCHSGRSAHHIKPRAVVICDAPLDFIRFWQSCEKAEQLAFHYASANEGRWVSNYVAINLGGRPEEIPHVYSEYSPFCYTYPREKKLEALSNIALRAYSEPDVHWWMANRGKDYYDMNTIDAAALVNTLQVQGHKEAELILTQDKGYRPNGQRHPHSWRIVDEEEMIDWFMAMLRRM